MQKSNPFVVRRPQNLDETHCVYIYTPLYSRLYVFTRVRGIYNIKRVPRFTIIAHKLLRCTYIKRGGDG